MDKASKIIANIENMNKLIPLTIEMIDEYMGEIGDNANVRELMSIMGSQATYLHNLATITLNNADVSPIDALKLNALREKTNDIAEECAKGLGITGNIRMNISDEEEDEEEEDDEEVCEEAILEFAKECKLNKTETAVLRKIVKGNGAPTDMTEKDTEVALKMAGKIEKAGKKLGF